MINILYAPLLIRLSTTYYIIFDLPVPQNAEIIPRLCFFIISNAFF